MMRCNYAHSLLLPSSSPSSSFSCAKKRRNWRDKDKRRTTYRVVKGWGCCWLCWLDSFSFVLFYFSLFLPSFQFQFHLSTLDSKKMRTPISRQLSSSNETFCHCDKQRLYLHLNAKTKRIVGITPLSQPTMNFEIYQTDGEINWERKVEYNYEMWIVYEDYYTHYAIRKCPEVVKQLRKEKIGCCCFCWWMRLMEWNESIRESSSIWTKKKKGRCKLRNSKNFSITFPYTDI